MLHGIKNSGGDSKLSKTKNKNKKNHKPKKIIIIHILMRTATVLLIFALVFCLSLAAAAATTPSKTATAVKINNDNAADPELSQGCAICLFLVASIENGTRNDEAQIIAALEKACNYLPTNYQSMVRSFAYRLEKNIQNISMKRKKKKPEREFPSTFFFFFFFLSPSPSPPLSRLRKHVVPIYFGS